MIEKITVSDLIRVWKKYGRKFQLENEDWSTIYKSDTEWTAKFFSEKKSTTDASPLGNFIGGELGLKYWTEDASFDISLYNEKNTYKNIPCIKNNENHATNYEIIIELENCARRAWEEMIKLTWVKCSIKVLVTYTDTDIENEMLVENFKSIIYQSNRLISENADNRYLLIIGDDKNNELNWHFYEFNPEGLLMT